jgi:hypothetical protein
MFQGIYRKLLFLSSIKIGGIDSTSVEMVWTCPTEAS